jgi:hypothetical protein
MDHTRPCNHDHQVRPRQEANAEPDKNRGIVRLTLEILRQLGIGVPKPRRFLGYRLKLVSDFGKLTARHRQTCRGHLQVTLQLQHLCLEGHLLTDSGLGGFSGSGLHCGRDGLGSLSRLIRRCCGCLEPLDLSLGKREPRRKRVPLGGSYCGGGLGGDGSVFRADVSLATAPATATRATTSASPAGSALRGVGAPRGHVSDLKTRGSTANRTEITSVAREHCRIKKESLTRRLTEVAGRMSSSKARRAKVIPRSKVWRAAASSSSSESASSPEVATHEVHASSSVRASPHAAPCERDAPVSSATWISRVVALAVVSGMPDTCSTAVGSSSTRASTPSTSTAAGLGGDVPTTPTTASAETGFTTGAGVSVAPTNREADAPPPDLH